MTEQHWATGLAMLVLYAGGFALQAVLVEPNGGGTLRNQVLFYIPFLGLAVGYFLGGPLWRIYLRFARMVVRDGER